MGSGPATKPLLSHVLPKSRFGHVPNGGRVYYERRSQPPLLTLMMESYLSHTNDTEFLRQVSLNQLVIRTFGLLRAAVQLAELAKGIAPSPLHHWA